MIKLVLFCLLALMLLSCGKRETENRPGEPFAAFVSSNKSFFEAKQNLKLVRQGPIPEATVRDCIFKSNRKKSCTFETLPLIGQGGNVSVDSILERTLVSDPLMGTRFEAALKHLNYSHLYQMFGAVTAVVISDKVNPSFYNGRTGAIYLSGRFLWLHQSEKKRLSRKKDLRGKGIYTKKNSELAYKFRLKIYADGERLNTPIKERSFSLMAAGLYRVLIHELAHANDYLPPTFYKSDQLRLNKRVGKLVLSRFRSKKLLSDNLPDAPLNPVMKMHQSFVNGDFGSGAALKTIKVGYFAEVMKKESATTAYAYRTSREDFATLVENMFTLADQKVERIEGIIEYPHPDFEIPKDYKNPILWGQKNRILVPRILSRAFHAVNKILPSVNEDQLRLKLESFETKNYDKGTPWNKLRL